MYVYIYIYFLRALQATAVHKQGAYVRVQCACVYNAIVQRRVERGA